MNILRLQNKTLDDTEIDDCTDITPGFGLDTAEVYSEIKPCVSEFLRRMHNILPEKRPDAEKVHEFFQHLHAIADAVEQAKKDDVKNIDPSQYASALACLKNKNILAGDILVKETNFDMPDFTKVTDYSVSVDTKLCPNGGLKLQTHITGGPYNSGILATGGKEGSYYNYDIAPQEIIEKVKKIEKVCSEYDVPLKAAALQFPLLHPVHLSVIPGGQSKSEMKNNFECIQYKIPKELWIDLKSKGLMNPEAPIK